MAIITQKPAELDILAVAGTPFTLTVNVTATDANDSPVPWSDFTNPSVVIQGAVGDGPAQSIPTVTSPSNNVVQVVWSGAQTSILLNGTYTWALQIDVDAAGPFSLVAGNLQMGNPTTPGVATSATADITVLVGTATANLDLTLDGGSGSGSITDITSNDHSVTVTNPTGPVVDLSVAGSIAGVASFNTRTGAVTAQTGDYTVSQVTGAAPLASPALTGTPTAPTKTPGTNNTDIATTAYSDLGVGVETTRATAAEVLLAPKASPALTGTPTTPTATVGTNTTQIASTAFVLANAGSGAVSSVFGRTGTVTATSGDYTVGQVTGAQAGPLTGDVTTSGAAATLKNTGPGATGPIGDGTHVATVTIDAQGRVTGLTSTAITTGGSGTVTSASVVSANGFAGTVATATSTPAITLSTTITGLLKGNGTAISAASAGTDYVTPTGSGATLTGITAAQVGALAIANNLSDINDAGSGRFNLSSPILSAAACVATANVSLSAPGATIDGYSLQSNDEVLLTAQSTPAQNGIWIWSGASSALVRPHEFPSAGVVKRGRVCLIANGTSFAGTMYWLVATAAGLTIDTSSQTWVSLNIAGTAANEAIIRANTLNQMAPPTGAILQTPQTFTSGGTWTPGANGAQLFACTIVGGGAGGSAGTATPNTGGGGGGGEVLPYFYLGNVTSPQTVTIGAGGAAGAAGNASSIGALVTAAAGGAPGSGITQGFGGVGGDGSGSGVPATGFTLNGSGISGGGGGSNTNTGGTGAPGLQRLGAGGGGGGGDNHPGGNGGGGGGGAGGAGVTNAGGGGGGGGPSGTVGTAGASTTGGAGGHAQANTGAGGGGGGAGTVTGGAGGAGGSGYCVIYQIA